LAGQIPVGFTTMAGATPYVQSGQLKLLATFGDQRDPQFPDTPTVAEAGYPSVVVVGWSGILAPAAVPAPIIAKLHAALLKVLDIPHANHPILPQPSTPVSTTHPHH